MAKAAQITGIHADTPAADGLRKILAVRIDELWGWGGLAGDPKNVRELHDMRIAAKRLRYCLEFFEPLLGSSTKPVLVEFKRLQDYLGEIHDCDVWAEMLKKMKRRDLKRKGGAGELAGEVDSLVEELAVRRGSLFCSFVAYWDRLEQQGFKEELLGMAGQVIAGEGKDGS